MRRKQFLVAGSDQKRRSVGLCENGSCAEEEVGGVSEFGGLLSFGVEEGSRESNHGEGVDGLVG